MSRSPDTTRAAQFLSNRPRLLVTAVLLIALLAVGTSAAAAEKWIVLGPS